MGSNITFGLSIHRFYNKPLKRKEPGIITRLFFYIFNRLLKGVPIDPIPIRSISLICGSDSLCGYSHDAVYVLIYLFDGGHPDGHTIYIFTAHYILE